MLVGDSFRFFTTAASVLALLAAGRASMAPASQVLPTVHATFAAPYDAVWDATLKSLAVPILQVADKSTGRIETQPFPFAYRPIRPPALEANGGVPAQRGGIVSRPTQAVRIAMAITVIRVGKSRTAMQVEPRIYDSLPMGFSPEPSDNPWLDLFLRISDRLTAR